KKRHEFQQKVEDNRLHKQLKFDLVKKYIDEYDYLLDKTKSNKEYKDLYQLHYNELMRFYKINEDFDQKNIRLFNILEEREYDIFIYIQSNFKNALNQFEKLFYCLDESKVYALNDERMMLVN